MILKQSKREENYLENINWENCEENDHSKSVEKVLNDHLNSVDSVVVQVLVLQKLFQEFFAVICHDKPIDSHRLDINREISLTVTVRFLAHFILVEFIVNLNGGGMRHIDDVFGHLSLRLQNLLESHLLSLNW